MIINWEKVGARPTDRIAENCARIKARLEPTTVDNFEPCAIVGYAPSLKDTWPEIKKFKTIFTCSGAYRFLRERGIISPYHVETDPQSHKVRNLGEPHRKTTFYMASSCDPNYFDLLEKYDSKVILFHIPLHGYPYVKGEWTLNCAGTVGHFVFTLARMLGYRDFHFFGFDHSTPTKGDTHAGRHDGFHHKLNYVEMDGLWTTSHWSGHIDSLLEVIDNAKPTVKVTWYGDGLLQRRAKTHVQTLFRGKVPMGVVGE